MASRIDEELRGTCLANASCGNVRDIKSNGKPHRLCKYHRSRVIRSRQRLEERFLKKKLLFSCIQSQPHICLDEGQVIRTEGVGFTEKEKYTGLVTTHSDICNSVEYEPYKFPVALQVEDLHCLYSLVLDDEQATNMSNTHEFDFHP